MKQTTFFMLFLFALVLSFGACEKEEQQMNDLPSEVSENLEVETRAAGQQSLAGWDLQWEDNFSYFNSNNWTKLDAPGGINAELGYITPRNVWISSGKLVLETDIKRSDDTDIGSRQYTSAKVISKNKRTLLYGRVDVRMKAAITQGTHNAAWLLHTPCDGINPCGANWPPELDIMEVIGREPDRAHQTVHYNTVYHAGYPNNAQSGQTTYFSSGNWPGQKYYTYSIEWSPSEVKWYIDGSLKKTWTGNGTNAFLPDREMYFLLDCAVGGSWAGYPNGTSTWPQRTYVDWIKVYKKSSGGGGGSSLVPNHEFDSGTNSWSSWGGSFASVSNANLSGSNAGKITLGNTSNIWDAGIKTGNFSLQSGKTYQISYQAKAASSKTIKVEVKQGNSYKTENWKTIQTGPNTYSFTWQANASGSNYSLSFFVGGNSHDFWVDNVIVQEQ